MNYGRIHRGPMTDDGFTQIANALLRSSKLSGNAVKIFGLLASHRDGYGVTVAQIVKHMKCGTDAVSSALRELEQFELLVRTRERRPDGTLGPGTDYYITDEKFLAREQENRRSEPKREKPGLGMTCENAEESEGSTTESAAESENRRKPAGQNLNGKNPVQANPGTKKNNHLKKTNEPSVRPERNAGASTEPPPERTDGRTENPPATETNNEATSVPSSDPAESAAAVLLAEAEIAAHLVRVDMRPEQWRRLETAVDAALLRFSTGQVARYLHDKARDAQTAMYVVRAFELYADAIVLVGEPHTTATRRTDAKLLEDLTTVNAPEPERPRCPEHPNSGRRAGGECSACFAAQFA